MGAWSGETEEAKVLLRSLLEKKVVILGERSKLNGDLGSHSEKQCDTNNRFRRKGEEAEKRRGRRSVTWGTQTFRAQKGVREDLGTLKRAALGNQERRKCPGIK